MIGVGGIPWPQTGTTPYHAQLGLSDKCHTIKGLVVCYVVWPGSTIYWMGLCSGQDGYLKYHNTPYIHKDTYQYNIFLEYEHVF